MEKEQLCKCNNCDTVMYDENPSEQPELKVPEGTRSMEKFDDEGESVWGCPECKTDEYLTDFSS